MIAGPESLPLYQYCLAAVLAFIVLVWGTYYELKTEGDYHAGRELDGPDGSGLDTCSCGPVVSSCDLTAGDDTDYLLG